MIDGPIVVCRQITIPLKCTRHATRIQEQQKMIEDFVLACMNIKHQWYKVQVLTKNVNSGKLVEVDQNGSVFKVISP